MVSGEQSLLDFCHKQCPGYSIADSKGNELVGLFYGGGFKLLGLQLTGFVSVAAWTVVTITIVFPCYQGYTGT